MSDLNESQDTIRVLRLVEYEGPRDAVERQIERSIHGVREYGNNCRIRTTTLGEFPVIVTKGEELVSARKQAYADGLTMAANTVRLCPNDSDPSISFRDQMNQLADDLLKRRP